MLFPPKTKEAKTEISVNALPEYSIRTMKDDLAVLTTKPEKGAPPEKLPIAPTKTPLPSAEELVSKEKEIWEIAPKPKLAPVKWERPKEEVKPVEKVGRKPRSLLVLIIILLILIGAGLFLYWQGQKVPPSPQPQPQPQPQPEAIQPSESLISVDETKIISPVAQTSLSDLLKQEAQLNQAMGTLKRLAILKNEEEFISLSDFFQKLNIYIPPYVLAELVDEYTLVLYNRNGKKLLGLITKIRNSENLKDQLKFWEETMANDLKKFFITESPGQPAITNFQDNIYLPTGPLRSEASEAGQEITIRYVNFPKPDLSIDYALVDNVFVLSTNRELTYKIVDKLLKTAE
jgi:hypothetical protein